VTQFGLRPGVVIRKDRKGQETRIKVRVSQIQTLSNDLALALAASPLRIEAPVPGRDIVGVEVPNVQISMVSLRGVMEAEEFKASRGALTFGLGRDVSGQAAVADLARMPHLLIAGATGSGKSVCINAIITALILTHTPDTLRFLMVDPKRVELTIYNGIPHLIAPVVVDIERAVPVLQWATREMERRYKLLSKASARNIEAYNDKLAARGEPVLPYIVILIDELADLMLAAPDETEKQLTRLAQMARATGIHLVIATQRPSVDVVTGLIKANFPARIAFAVTSGVDSRVVLDTPGAEKLLGRGDMLYMASDSSKLSRLQGCFVSDEELARLVNHWREKTDTENYDIIREAPWKDMETSSPKNGGDELIDKATKLVRQSGTGSISFLQRKLGIGYPRAARLMDQLEALGIVGPDEGGGKVRAVLPPQEPVVETGRGKRKK
jgi:DNA segregation ATPase FtsK/SpoIIIE, S-DNA-T family